jgi:hypothetical protein
MMVNGDMILWVDGSENPGEAFFPCAMKLVSVDNKRLAADAYGYAELPPAVGQNTQSFDQEDR